MRLIDLSGQKGRKLPFFFAVEEYVARNFHDSDYFAVWQVPPTVMVGRNQLLENEVDTAYCKARGIDVFRRKSGGGCVYSDKGCLQFSYITSGCNVEEEFSRYMGRIAALLSDLGIAAAASGRNDIVVDGKKVAGSAFYRMPGRSVLHNTLLFSTDLGELARTLTPHKAKLESKGVESVSQRVANLCQFTEMGMDDFIGYVVRNMCAEPPLELSEKDLAAIAEIEKKLSSDDYTYGKNPAYTDVKRRRFDGVGTVEAHMEVKGGVIKSINFMGDYFLMGDIDGELVARLRGVAPQWDSIVKALGKTDVGGVIRGMDAAKVARLIAGRPPHVMKPDWLKISIASKNRHAATAHTISSHGLNTICSSGLCPNRAECWAAGTATIMICGNVCTRNCRFCNTATGKPLPLDAGEPGRVAAAVKEMGLKHVVVTSVDRDDLPDYGAGHWRQTIVEIRRACPGVRIEALIPDFRGEANLLDTVISAGPDIVAHNMETVERLTPKVRSVARYGQSLSVLRHISKAGTLCKTGLMVGLGETDEEVVETMKDVSAAGCSILTIGQYLQPSSKHLPVERYVEPDTFVKYKAEALALGFKHVESGPLVRSSYHAERAVLHGPCKK